jgi:hypothetical protein
MAYTIYKADGTAVTVADNSIDTAFYNSSGGSLSTGQGVELIGRNTLDYGAAIAQNFLQITENFASSTGTQPIGAVVLQGQLWFDKALSKLYVRTTAPAAGANSMANWQQVVTSDSTGNSSISGNLQVTNTITAEGGLRVPVIFSTLPVLPQVAHDGDILVIGSVISIFANAGWQQVFPAIYL